MPAPRTVTVERTIAAPPHEVFTWLSTATNYTASPLVLSAKLVEPGTDGAFGLGARREVTSLLAWFEEEITDFDPPHSFNYLIRRSVPPIRHEHGRLDFSRAPNGTHVRWTSTFAVDVPVLGAALAAAAAPIVAQTFAGLLAAADRALSTATIEGS